MKAAFFALTLAASSALFLVCMQQAVRAEDPAPESTETDSTADPQTTETTDANDAGETAQIDPRVRAEAAIAVLPFRLPEQNAELADRDSEASDTAADSEKSEDPRVDARLAARLTSALAVGGRFTLVERAELGAALQELALSQSGMVSEADMLEAGRLAGARYLVLGELSPMRGVGKQYRSTYRVIKSETGVVIAAGGASGTYDQISATMAAQLREKLSVYLLLNNPDSPYSILLQTDRGKDAVYRVGETIEIRFQIKKHRDGAPDTVYVTLYAIDARGRMTMIYPNKFTPQAAVQVGQEVRLPDPRDDYVWRLAPPAGTESVQAIITEREVDFFQMRNRYRTEAFPTVPGARDNERTFGAIVTELKEEKLGDWAAERITYRLLAD